MALLDYMNPFNVFRNYVRVPVEAFVLKHYCDYKKRTNKGISSVKELLYRAAIVTLFVTAILWISVFMYVVFYYTYMPNVTHVRPVHLQFKSCEEQMGICSFPSAHVQLTKRSHMLMAAQPYRIKLILDMPESQINKDLDVHTGASIPKEIKVEVSGEQMIDPLAEMSYVVPIMIDSSTQTSPSKSVPLRTPAMKKILAENVTASIPQAKISGLQEECGSGNISQLAEAVQALARANVSIGDALMALASRVTNNKP